MIYKREGSPNWQMKVSRYGTIYRENTCTSIKSEAVEMHTEWMKRFAKQKVTSSWRTAVSKFPARWFSRRHANLRVKSVKRGWNTVISVDGLKSLLLQSNGICAVSGKAFSLPVEKRGEFRAYKHDPYSISIDRIDSSQGYKAGNIRFVCLIVNIAMSDWGEELLRDLVRIMAASKSLVTSDTVIGGVL